jgi:pimeloyl-ACP methyl ester carboxylesterase
MPFAEVNDVRLYYEFTGPEDKPIILQFGGSLFGRHNFAMVNDGFRENFRLLSYDASGYGRSDQPIELYSIEGWAEEALGLVDALGVERVLTHGTSMGGMIALAFTAMYPERTIASCADCAFARGDVYRKTLVRNWRRSFECMPMDEVSDLITIQAVSAAFIEDHPDIFEQVRQMVNKNAPYTVRHACLAVEFMDLEPLARKLSRPILFTNGTLDVMTPPRLAKSGFSAEDIVEAMPDHARLYEFPHIGHADLLEAPEEAIATVTAFFHEVLDREGIRR